MLDDPFLLDHTQEWDLKVTSPDQKVQLTVTTTVLPLLFTQRVREKLVHQ